MPPGGLFVRIFYYRSRASTSSNTPDFLNRTFPPPPHAPELRQRRDRGGEPNGTGARGAEWDGTGSQTGRESGMRRSGMRRGDFFGGGAIPSTNACSIGQMFYAPPERVPVQLPPAVDPAAPRSGAGAGGGRGGRG